MTTLISATMPRKCASFSKKPGYRDFVVNTGKRHAQETFRETALHKSQKKRRKTYEPHSVSPITYLGHNQAGNVTFLVLLKFTPKIGYLKFGHFAFAKSPNVAGVVAIAFESFVNFVSSGLFKP